MSNTTLSVEALRGLYDDIEIAILCDWLRLDRPPALADIDTEATIQAELPSGQPGPIRLLESYDRFDYGHDTRLANAVARLALNAIADRLPQWAAVSQSGDWVFARARQQRRVAAVDPLPRFLLTINWADSGPGFSWPESYHATWLPGFDCFVVTLSDDSPEAHGYTDIAIGNFPADGDFDAEVKRIVCDFWNKQTHADPEQAWEHLFDEGCIDAETAYRWRAAVWCIEPDESDDDEDDVAEN
jgi:hypothetical protein